MEPLIVYEDEVASIVFGHKPAALGHLKVYPKQKVQALEELSAKDIAHLFTLATRCASLLFDGLQAQGTNIILNDGKNANQTDDNICIDVIARTEGDGMKYAWDVKQGNYEQVKKTASEIASKVVVYEKPAEPARTPEPAKVLEKVPVPPSPIIAKPSEMQDIEKPVPLSSLGTKAAPPSSPVTDKDDRPHQEPPAVKEEKTDTVMAPPPSPPTDMPDRKTNFLYYELMRMP